MRRGRLITAGAVGAALGVLLAPRLGESRRAALTRLRLALRSGRGSVGAFAGTPCSQAGSVSSPEGRREGRPGSRPTPSEGEDRGRA